MKIKEQNEDGRIVWKYPPVPDGWGYHNLNFRSFYFKIFVWCVISNQWKKYGGRHTLQSKYEDWKEYKGSIGKSAKKKVTIKNAEEYKMLLATSPKVIIEVIEWTTLNNAGYGEIDMLYDEINDEESSKNWFNSTGGQGGYGAQGYVASKQVEEVYDRIRKLEKTIEELWNPESHKYPKEVIKACAEGTIESRIENTMKYVQEEYDDVFELDFSYKGELEEMLKNFLQTRAVKLIGQRVTYFKEQFDLDSNPNRFGFSIQLMPKSGVKTDRRVGSSNHRGTGCVKSENGIGMWSIGIPHYIHGKWKSHVINFFFSQWNPQLDMNETRVPHSAEDDAQIIVDYLNGEKLFVKDEKGNDTPDLNHKWVANYFKKHKYAKNKKDKCIEECEAIIDDSRLQLKGDKLQTYSESDLKNDLNLKKSYYEKVNKELKTYEERDENGKTTGNTIINSDGIYDSHIKISMSADIEAKVQDHFYSHNYEKNFEWNDCGEVKLTDSKRPKIKLNLYSKSITKIKRWETSAKTKRTNAITNEERLRTTIALWSNYMDIEYEILPAKRSKALSDGWIKEIKKEKENDNLDSRPSSFRKEYGDQTYIGQTEEEVQQGV